MYTKINDPQSWLLGEVLREQADRLGNKQMAGWVDGTKLNYDQACDQAARLARGLLELGVKKGDIVAVILPNSRDHLLVWFALDWLGAVYAPLNPELSNTMLVHALAVVDCQHILIDARFFSCFASSLHKQNVIITGADDPSSCPNSPGKHKATMLGDFSTLPALAPFRGESRDLAALIQTAGAGGGARAVCAPQSHCFLFGLGSVENFALHRQDVIYVALPFFHVNGLFMQIYSALICGASLYIRPRFSASNWLYDIRSSKATVTNMLGAMMSFVVSQPPSAQDGEHGLRLIAAAPNPPELDRIMRDRFKVQDVIGLYGMSEVNIVLYTKMGQPRPGSCGRVYDRYFDVTIRHRDSDAPVPVGAIGEIMVRPKIPFGFMDGYHNMAQQTVDAWRNLWFHTGDCARMDAQGYVYFVDRMRDVIRRRGENISACDIEIATTGIAAIAAAAAYGVGADEIGGEQEIMLAVLPKPAVVLSADAIWRYLADHLPAFACPRFIKIIEGTMPDKAQLRKIGRQGAIWDAKKAKPGRKP